MGSERFAWLQSALRETYKTLYVAGDSVLDRSVLEDRIARVNKLYLNGWDDLNGNKAVDAPQECLKGRLQMGEQALTGELGRDGLGRPTPDRDGDCVLELAHAGQASVQASDVFFHTAADAMAVKGVRRQRRDLDRASKRGSMASRARASWRPASNCSAATMPMRIAASMNT